MGLLRFLFGLIGVVLGAYVIYAAVIAIHHGTNPAWVAFVTLLMATLSVLLLRAAWDRPPDRVTAQRQVVAVALAAAVGGARGYYLGHIPGLVIGTIVGALVGALYLVADSSRHRSNRHRESHIRSEQ
jgi:hypothetical protein